MICLSVGEIDDLLPRLHQSQLIAGDVGLALGVVAVLHGVLQIGVHLGLGRHLGRQMVPIRLGRLDLAAQIERCV